MRPDSILAVLGLVLAGCLAPAAEQVAPASVPTVTCATPCVTVVEDKPAYAWEPSVAVDPRDPLRVLAASTSISRFPTGVARPFWIDLHTSTDGGASWTSAPFPGGFPSPAPGDPHATHTALADPVLAFLPDGTALLSYLALTNLNGIAVRGNAGLHAYVARSADGGATWETPVRLAEGHGLTARLALRALPTPDVTTPRWEGHDKPWIAVGPDGTVLAAWSWIQSPAYDCQIVFAASTDAGVTWTPYEVVDASGPCFSGAAPLVTATAWHVAYHDFDEGTLRIATSRDRGVTWDVQDLGETTWAPFLRAGPGPAGERLWLAYSVGAGGEGRDAPVVRWSDDGGETWSAPVTLEPGAAEGRATPALDVAADGTAYVAWFHHSGSDDEPVASVRVQAFRADGATLDVVGVAPELPTTAEAVGDYFGLAAWRGGAVVVFGAPDDGGDLDVVSARVAVG